MIPLSLLVGAALAASPSLESAAAEAGVAWPPPAVWIDIDKSERRLTLYSGEQPLKDYQVGLADGDGDKTREGDLKTPTGTFRVVTRNPKSSFHLFLGISYPNPEDAARGLDAGLISQAQHDQIVVAAESRKKPPWNTTLGGAIGIHGGGGSADWTLGCIAVEDAEIEELWAVTRMGTKVRIQE